MVFVDEFEGEHDAEGWAAETPVLNGWSEMYAIDKLPPEFWHEKKPWVATCKCTECDRGVYVAYSATRYERENSTTSISIDCCGKTYTFYQNDFTQAEYVDEDDQTSGA